MIPVQRLLARARLAGASPFVRAVGVLASGSVLAQMLNIAVLPLLTRIYTPDQFSALAVFASLSIMASLGACLGFDLAIPMARTRRDAAGVALCALLSLVGVTFVVAIVVAVMLKFFGDADFVAQWPRATFVLLPVSTLIIGGYNLVEYWTMRQRRFGTIARARVVQALCGSAIQISLGLLGYEALGLFIGYIAISGLGLIGLLAALLRRDTKYFSFVGRETVATSFRRYTSFIRYTGPEAWANAASVYVPMMLIGASADTAAIGFVMLAQRLLQAPLMLIGRSVSQVYTSGAAQSLLDGRLSEETARVLRALIATVGIPAILTAIVAPGLANMVLGSSWRPVGLYIALLMPWAILHFLASSVVTTMHVRGLNARVMLMTTGGLAVRSAAVGWALVFRQEWVVEAYALSGLVYYAALLAAILRANAISVRRILPAHPAFVGGLMAAGVLAAAIYIIR